MRVNIIFKICTCIYINRWFHIQSRLTWNYSVFSRFEQNFCSPFLHTPVGKTRVVVSKRHLEEKKKFLPRNNIIRFLSKIHKRTIGFVYTHIIYNILICHTRTVRGYMYVGIYRKYTQTTAVHILCSSWAAVIMIYNIYIIIYP